MKKINDKSKIYMIVGVVILIIAIVGSTYAYYRYVLTSTNVNTITRGLDYYINYAKGTDITSGTLNPSKDYTGGNNITVTLNKKDNTYNIYGHIYLDISNISTALSSSNALKYVVLEGTTKISEGVLGEVSSGESYLLAVNIPLKTTTTTYTIYLWFDETNSIALSVVNTSVSAKVRCEAMMQEIDDETYTAGIASHIKFMYNGSTKTPVVNNNITYQYDTTHSLMKDVGGNIRYYGASPNNYIYFNCSDYYNQTDSTCEKWRIIGVFNNSVKLIRNDSIGLYSWDNKNTSTGAESVYGKNDWTDARLMKLLNPGYESETTGGSLYYNLKSGNCYAGQNNATKSCNFTSTGIKNDVTRNLIKTVTYTTGGWNTNIVYPNFIYEKEMGKTVYTGSTISWKGKVALMYPSDYSYAADLSKCKDSSGNSLTINNYNSSVNSYQCRSNNYLYKGVYEWLITPHSGYSDNAWGVTSAGHVYGSAHVSENWNARPVLFLSARQGVDTGDGTSSNPYKLSLN